MAQRVWREFPLFLGMDLTTDESSVELSKHPWNKWFDGKIWKLHVSKDLHVGDPESIEDDDKCEAMMMVCWVAFTRLIRVSIEVDDDYLLVQAKGPCENQAHVLADMNKRFCNLLYATERSPDGPSGPE